MQTDDTSTATFADKYYIGIKHYRTIFTQLETIRQLTFILSLGIALIQECAGLAVVIISWNSSAVPLQIIAISYLAVLLIVLVGFPAFFIQGNSWGRSEATLNENHIDRVKRFIYGAIALPIFAALYYIIGPQSSQLQSQSGTLYYTLFILLIFTASVVYWPIVLACVYFLAILTCVPCVFRDYFLERMNRQHRGATTREINKFPTFTAKLDKTEESEKEKPGFLFRLFKFKKSNIPEMVIDEEHNQCCVCISEYENGQVLRQLGCNHYFHQACIDQWLSMNATCPLCINHV
ncbi:hypothetical protein HDV06_004466 [Boothiomyces sp. JEL0866]|nr:hypothetical protein HDV06_004466 [Boothiomyces sp. JEL0866]